MPLDSASALRPSSAPFFRSAPCGRRLALGQLRPVQRTGRATAVASDVASTIQSQADVRISARPSDNEADSSDHPQVTRISQLTCTR